MNRAVQDHATPSGTMRLNAGIRLLACHWIGHGSSRLSLPPPVWPHYTTSCSFKIIFSSPDSALPIALTASAGQPSFYPTGIWTFLSSSLAIIESLRSVSSHIEKKGHSPYLMMFSVCSFGSFRSEWISLSTLSRNLIDTGNVTIIRHTNLHWCWTFTAGRNQISWHRHSHEVRNFLKIL